MGAGYWRFKASTGRETQASGCYTFRSSARRFDERFPSRNDVSPRLWRFVSVLVVRVSDDFGVPDIGLTPSRPAGSTTSGRCAETEQVQRVLRVLAGSSEFHHALLHRQRREVECD